MALMPKSSEPSARDVEKRAGEADRDARCRQPCAVADHDRPNFRGARAERNADAEFVRAFADRVRHHAVHANQR